MSIIDKIDTQIVNLLIDNGRLSCAEIARQLGGVSERSVRYRLERILAEGVIKNTNGNTFGIDESADVGTDENTPVNPAYHGKEHFKGKIASVTIETFPKK